MNEAARPFLTTHEVADLLRLKERKVYDLVAEGEIPCVRVSGKLLFPVDLIEAWIARNTEFKAGTETLQERPPICAGSHDPLLDWALREADTGLAVSFNGSAGGLEHMAAGTAALAGLHLPDEQSSGWNVGHVRRQLGARPVVLIEWAKRTQGLVVARGNPQGIKSVEDLKKKRVIGRQHGAGASALFGKLLADGGLKLQDVKMSAAPARTEADVAAAIAERRADAGLAIEAVARQSTMDFVPLTTERYDLVVWRRAYFEPPMQKLMKFCRTPEFMARAEALGGYDVSGLGTVHYNGP
jgi:excisionase family DNA binding protein